MIIDIPPLIEKRIWCLKICWPKSTIFDFASLSTWTLNSCEFLRLLFYDFTTASIFTNYATNISTKNLLSYVKGHQILQQRLHPFSKISGVRQAERASGSKYIILQLMARVAQFLLNKQSGTYCMLKYIIFNWCSLSAIDPIWNFGQLSMTFATICMYIFPQQKIITVVLFTTQ